MRALPFKIIVVTALSALAPAAYGSVRTHVSHIAKAATAQIAHAHPAKKVVESARPSSRRAAKPGKVEKKLAAAAAKPAKPGLHGRPVVLARAEKAGPHKKSRHQQEEEPAPPVRTKLVHGRRVVLHAVPAPKLIAKVQAPRPRAVEVQAPEPEPVLAPTLDPIHVTHDRKQHFTADPVPGDTGGIGGDDADAPRKATPADFLSVGIQFAAPAPAAVKVVAVKAPAPKLGSQPAIPSADKLASNVRPSPTAGVVVGSKVELKPTPLPVMQVATEPLVALYDKRGRLIVPPAMKGSHEVLIRQNVMADSDGLERIQDDEHLSRMRAGKLLVALPDSEGIQTDDRLPSNRRYCRPWTAAFLTALARAHYARFHSPLQVNSAVRTVEFQQRLIRTNGNAAPAEGETASPHLTGQAVDIAKHGLSMTEIAWLRGYLLPLVQEGKVDVEEEFQQACFHISVYKKYLPQPAPRRNIAAEKLGHGTTLAIALP